MNDNLDLHYRIAAISNRNLENVKVKKSEMINEIFSSDLLSATLKAHMYIEHELNLLYEYFFGNSKTFCNLKFAMKLDLLHELKMIETDLFSPIKVLNQLRNDFAHKLNFTDASSAYKRLSNTLSNYLKSDHKLELKMKVLLYGQLNDEEKFKILLAQIWIHVVIFFSSKERRKKELGERFISEVMKDIETQG